jgi:hypothetical protein
MWIQSKFWLLNNYRDFSTKEITVYDDYVVVKVDIRIADETDREFQFTYNRDIEIHGLEPPYGYYYDAQTLVVEGKNFHPHEEISCKYTLGTETKVVATFLTNKTVSWDIPAIDTSYTIPYYMVRLLT